MKKKFIIKRRYEVLCEIEYVLQNKCRLCPKAGNNYSLEPCEGCPALHMLNAAGKELDALTLMYRAENEISKNGKAGEEHVVVEEVKDLTVGVKQPYDIMQENFTPKKHAKLKAQGYSIKEIANIYGVKEGYLYWYLRNLKNGVDMTPKERRTNETKLDEIFGDIEGYKRIKKENKYKIEDMAKKYGFPKVEIIKWLRKKKDKAGIL